MIVLDVHDPINRKGKNIEHRKEYNPGNFSARIHAFSRPHIHQEIQKSNKRHGEIYSQQNKQRRIISGSGARHRKGVFFLPYIGAENDEIKQQPKREQKQRSKCENA